MQPVTNIADKTIADTTGPETTTVVTEIVKPGIFGRTIDRFRTKPLKTTLVLGTIIGVGAAAYYIVVNRKKILEDVNGASDVVTSAVEVAAAFANGSVVSNICRLIP